MQQINYECQPVTIYLEQAIMQCAGVVQGWIKCCIAVATVRAEQGPCEPSKGFVSKFGEQKRARESLREPEGARESRRGSQREPETL